MNSERVNKVLSLASASTQTIFPWKFVQVGKLIINGQHHGLIGEIYYSNPNFELGGAIQLGDWVFALERGTPQFREQQGLDDQWVISGFHGSLHCSFQPIPNVNEQERNSMLLSYVIPNFSPIFKGDSEPLFKASWEIQPL